MTFSPELKQYTDAVVNSIKLDTMPSSRLRDP
jgi:hypothetical protein